METSVDPDFVKSYLSEHTQQETEFEEEEHILLNEVENATDFLHKAGLSNLSKLFQEGKEITEALVNDSVRQRHLTEKQAQTVRSRVVTLNKTLRSRQPRKKQRQDVRDVAWNVETSSTGTRSRSATPDSLDSLTGLHDDITSDDDQPSLPNFPHDSGNMVFKGKLKWSSSEPLQNKFSRSDRGDVAHLGSENVVLKGYQPLSEYGSLTRPTRERSGSDPTTEVHLKPYLAHSSVYLQSTNLGHHLSRSHSNLLVPNENKKKVYVTDDKSEPLSFEKQRLQNDYKSEGWENINDDDNSVNIDDLSDSEYQYLKPLMYVELTAIFDQYKINVLKRKASSKRKKGNVFGVNLSTLVMRDMPRPETDNSMVPEIYRSVINHLKTRCIREDGILRVAGQKQKLEYLCKEIEEKFYNSRIHVENILQQTTVHDLTGVLKKLLRDLPDPIFTMELFDMFYKCSKIPSERDKIKALNLLVLMLPVEHRNTFRLLLEFFLKIIENKQYNRMDLHNVAMICAPSFFPPRLLLPKESANKLIVKPVTKEELEKQINDAAICCCTMELILRRGTKLWFVPADLAEQAREAQKKAQNKKYGKKKKLARSSTQYEPGAIVSPRIKRDFLI